MSITRLALFSKPETVKVPMDEIRLPTKSDGYKIRDVDPGSDTFLDLVLYVLTNGRTINSVNTRKQKGMKGDVVWGGSHRFAAIQEANSIITSEEYRAQFEADNGITLDPDSFVKPITELEVQRWNVTPEQAHALAMIENFGIQSMTKFDQSAAVAAFLSRKGNQVKTRIELANALGVSEGTIKNLQVLGDLTPAMEKAGREGLICAAVLYAVGRLSKGEQNNWLEYCQGGDAATTKIKTIQQRGADIREGAAPGGAGAKAAAEAANNAPQRMTFGQMTVMLEDLLEGSPKVLGKTMSATEQTIRISLLQEILGLDVVSVNNLQIPGHRVQPREVDGNLSLV